MAKLHFKYGAMNSGKSDTLIKTAYNYEERGLNVAVVKPAIDTKGDNKIVARGGHSRTVDIMATPDTDLTAELKKLSKVACILADEAQFLTQRQVFELGEIADLEGIPVLAHGLRTDFQGQLFEGIQYLLALSDVLSESKTVCHCGRKATMVLGIDGDGKPLRSGEQIKVGGNESYVSVCRRHFKEGMAERSSPTLPFTDFDSE